MRTATILLLPALLASAASPGISAPAAPVAKAPACFRADQFHSWKAPNATTIYIRVYSDRYYRLDLAASCPQLLWPDAHLVTRFDGTNMVCNALDWNLKVSAPSGLPEPCIVKSMTALSAAQVQAIPKKFKP